MAENENYLKLAINKEDRWTGSLISEVKAGYFSGRSKAYFNLSEIKDFAKNLRNFGETLQNPPHIFGGYWNEDGSISEVHLSLRFYCYDKTGHIGVHVELNYNPYTQDYRPEEVSKVAVELHTTPDPLIQFANKIKSLVDEKIDEAILIGE